MNQKEIPNSIDFDYDNFLNGTQIIEERKQIDLILDKIKSSLKESNKKFNNLKLIYSAVEDGDSVEDFHKNVMGMHL